MHASHCTSLSICPKPTRSTAASSYHACRFQWQMGSGDQWEIWGLFKESGWVDLFLMLNSIIAEGAFYPLGREAMCWTRWNSETFIKAWALTAVNCSWYMLKQLTCIILSLNTRLWYFSPRYWLCHEKNCHFPFTNKSGDTRRRQVSLQDAQHPQELRAFLYSRSCIRWIHKGTGQQKYQGRFISVLPWG